MKSNASIGHCGEYFVAAELERRGFTCAVPMSNTQDFDVLAINRETLNQCAIQVKTTKNKSKNWVLNQKADSLCGKNIYYVFVSLNGLENPSFHIVPSKYVSETISKEHDNWLKTPGKKGQMHNDNKIRKFSDEKDQFLDKWDVLK